MKWPVNQAYRCSITETNKGRGATLQYQKPETDCFMHLQGTGHFTATSTGINNITKYDESSTNRCPPQTKLPGNEFKVMRYRQMAKDFFQ